jgi:arginine N-succinyltransferase
MIIRPVTRADAPSILTIAKAAGIGMTSLPADEEVLREKVERAASTFEGTLKDSKDALYFFVLEDPSTSEIVGTCGIVGTVGLKRPMYSYKLTTVTQYSDTLDIFSRNDMLQIVNDYTGASELVSLFLMPEYRRDRLGRFLSRVRFLFMAAHRERFAERTVAEIRGWHDEQGRAPFYDSLARKFFQMDFSEADWICATKGNRFISELMPTYPIYVSLLAKEAQATIGKPHVNSEAAKAMLEREGFSYSGYLDVFDGGPTVEADTDMIRTVQYAKHATVCAVEELHLESGRRMIALPRMADFRACLGYVSEREDGTVSIDANTALWLGISAGDAVCYASA